MTEKESENFKGSGLFDNFRKLINVIDELRDVGLQQYIKLPRIAVVGSQSSGKSSLLESIVGIDFLPRGSGVVTRRPLELRLVHVPLNERTIKPYAVFENDKNKKWENFDEVRNQIDFLTDQVAGKRKKIVNDPIIMTVYSNDVIDMTIIDLPGITRIPLQNSEQMGDIEKVTKDLTYSYIRDERTIILCVVPGNQDISNADGLQLTREVDREGNRTIDVITKIDIIDQGTDARRMIMGVDIPLKLGYVGVKGRSQQDIHENKRVNKALDEERDFFANHKVYSTMEPKFLGTKALTQKLSSCLFNHIRNILPAIVKEIKDKFKECENRLQDLDPALPIEQKEKMQLIWTMITDFTENFKNSIKGRYDQRRTPINTEINDPALTGGAVIKMMVLELLENTLINIFTIKLHQDDSIPGFPSIDSFLYLINPQLEKLKDPAFEYLTKCYNYLEGLANKILQKIFSRFPTVLDQIAEITSKVLQAVDNFINKFKFMKNIKLKQRDVAKEVVSDIIESEQGYIFTNDLGYLAHKMHLIHVSDGQEGQQCINSEKAFINELRSRVDIYFNIVVRNLRDSVPKAIGFFLVKNSKSYLHYQLYQQIMISENSLGSITEVMPIHITEEIKSINKTIEVLRKATRVIKRDPE